MKHWVGRTYRELGTRLLDVLLERREVLAVPVQVDVVEGATGARLDHLLQPVKPLARARARGDRGERLLNGERVDVLLVPRRRMSRRDTVQVRLIEREDGYRPAGGESSSVNIFGDSEV